VLQWSGFKSFGRDPGPILETCPAQWSLRRYPFSGGRPVKRKGYRELKVFPFLL